METEKNKRGRDDYKRLRVGRVGKSKGREEWERKIGERGGNGRERNGRVKRKRMTKMKRKGDEGQEKEWKTGKDVKMKRRKGKRKERKKEEWAGNRSNVYFALQKIIMLKKLEC